ncbi:MAG: hypothetical protein AMXMBFR7_33750 [Planctomycetota bacterium]
MSMRMKAIWVLGLALALGAGAPVEAADGATPEQVAQWIKDLGDENFDVRTAAQESLVKSGSPAVEPLKAAQTASQDIEVKNAIGQVLLRLKWAAVPGEAQYLDLFPADTVMVAGLSNASASWGRLKESAFGKLLQGEAFKPLMGLADKEMKGAPGWPLIEKWLARFNGSAAAGLWAFNPMDPAKMGAALVVQLPAEEPEKVLRELLADTGLDQGLQADTSRGLPLWAAPGGNGALALAGRHMIFASNPDSAMRIADGLIAPAEQRLTTSPAYSKLRPHLGEGADFTFVMNMAEYQKMLGGMMAMMGGGNLLEKLGYDALEYVALASHIRGPMIEDRMVVSISEKETSLTKIMNMGWKSPTPLKDIFAVVPADAVLVGNSYVDGAGLLEYFVGYMKGIAEMQAQMGQPIELNPDEMIPKAEAIMGLKMADVAGAVQGDLVYWAKLHPGLIPPDIGMALTCASPEKSAELAATFEKVVNAAIKSAEGKDAPAIEKQTKEGATIWIESEDSPLLEDPQRKAIPYRLCWTVSGNRVLFGSSALALQNRLKGIAAAEPAYDPAKLVGELPPGQLAPKVVMSLDLKQILELGVKQGIPMAAMFMPAEQAELQQALLGLTQQPELFKDLPPVTGLGFAPQAGVQVTVVRSPVGMVPAYGGLMAGVVGYFMMQRGEAAGVGGGVVGPAPGGF